MSLSSKQESYLRVLIYPVQFERHPLDGVDRILEMIRRDELVHDTPENILSAIQAGLSSDQKLARLIPQSHPEEAIRAYLKALAHRLENDQS